MQTFFLASAILVIFLFGRILQKWYYHRTKFRGLPQPPHSMLWGHLKIMDEAFREGPPRAAVQTLIYDIRKKYNLGDVFYMDLWPASDPFMIVVNPHMFDQITGPNGLKKHAEIPKFLEHIGGRETNLVVSEGAYWKRWRAAFNPGFSGSYLMTLVPSIIDHVVIFRDILIEKGKSGELFRLEKPCTRLTIDIIGEVVLDHQLNSQREENTLVTAFESQIRWLKIGALTKPSELIDFRRPFIFWKNTRIMNHYISKLLDKRFESMKKRSKQKRVIDLALEAYLKEEKGQSLEQATQLDPVFKRHALDHIKTFIFAGHDTTSATVCYCYHLLAKNSEAMTKLRAEHDDVFGKNPNDAQRVLSDEPHLINKLPYTTAVIKEVLRLYPPASTLREGDPNVAVSDPDTGKHYPLFNNMMVYPVNVSLHRSEQIWGSTAQEFLPERWMTSEEIASDLSNKAAYVPFSRGPRNCIGQELALIESRIILALTIRSFDVTVAYDELHKLKDDGSGYPNDTHGLQFGDTAYQVQFGTAKPREGMPCRILPVSRL